MVVVVIQNGENALLAEIATAQREAHEKAEKLQLATDHHIGLEILHAFVLDVLGRDTPVARIFQSTADESFRHTQVRNCDNFFLLFAQLYELGVFDALLLLMLM